MMAFFGYASTAKKQYKDNFEVINDGFFLKMHPLRKNNIKIILGLLMMAFF